jgi:hypothetical protein
MGYFICFEYAIVNQAAGNCRMRITLFPPDKQSIPVAAPGIPSRDTFKPSLGTLHLFPTNEGPGKEHADTA